MAATIDEANRLAKEEVRELDAELRRLRSDVAAWTKELPTATVNRQADLHERLAGAERRATELHDERAKVVVIDPDEVTEKLKDFDALWSAMTPAEQSRVVELLVQRVDYSGETGRVVVTFNPTGILGLGAAA